MKPLEPNEVRLEGQWLKAGDQVIADDTARRIDELISSELTRVSSSKDGWDVLYVDERDGRMWELTYPHSEWHGGGPPSLTNVTEDYARTKYGL
jgi:hypothetical protein